MQEWRCARGGTRRPSWCRSGRHSWSRNLRAGIQSHCNVKLISSQRNRRSQQGGSWRGRSAARKAMLLANSFKGWPVCPLTCRVWIHVGPNKASANCMRSLRLPTMGWSTGALKLASMALPTDSASKWKTHWERSPWWAKAYKTAQNIPVASHVTLSCLFPPKKWGWQESKMVEPESQPWKMKSSAKSSVWMLVATTHAQAEQSAAIFADPSV